MNIKKKIIGTKEYFYLEHSFRKGSKVIKKELYLGSKIPSNLKEIKAQFQAKILQEQFYDKFELIKKNFSTEFQALPPSAKEKDLNYFMIKFTYDTNRIEGSTITLKETAKILEQGITPINKPLHDIKETEAHRKVFFEMINCSKDLSLQLILKWHKLLLNSTQPDIAGRIRTHQVRVAGSKMIFPLPVEIDLLLKEFMTWYHKNKTRHPVELAALVHLKFVSIHPFTDGNGRISRLLMNFILHRHNYPMLNIKYTKRDSYYNALERSQLKKDDSFFIRHTFGRYLKEFKQYLKK